MPVSGKSTISANLTSAKELKVKATLTISKDGKINIENLPKNLPPGEYVISRNFLFSVGTKNLKKFPF